MFSLEFKLKVSIILSVHGNRKTVGQTIQSIVSQTYSDWELIICFFDIDNEVKAIIDFWRDRDSRISLQQVFDKGYVPPLNIGLKAIKDSPSDFICMIDSDDIMLPSRLEAQVTFLERNLDYVLVGGQRILIDLDNRILLNKSGNYPMTNYMIRRKMVLFPPIIHPAVLIRRKALYEINGYREEFPHGTDSDLWMRIREHGKFYNLSQAVIAYRIDSSRPLDPKRDQLWKEILHVANCFKFRHLDEDVDLLDLDPENWLKQAYNRMNSMEDVDRADRYFYAVAKLHNYSPEYKGFSLSKLYRIMNSFTWLAQRLKWRLFLPFNIGIFILYRLKWQRQLNQIKSISIIS